MDLLLHLPIFTGKVHEYDYELEFEFEFCNIKYNKNSSTVTYNRYNI